MSKGLPYMGSKRKLSSKIVSEIIQRHPHATHFYDLFGGGGAISFEALKYRKLKVHYNELNTSIYSLIKYLKENDTLEDKFYDWVSREEFFKQLEESDWYSGFVQSCWSFGNNPNKGYLYGKDIEENKRLAHEIVVNRCKESAHELGFTELGLFDIEDLHTRRKVFCKFHKDKIQSLGYLEHIQSLQDLKRLQELEMTNQSYQDVYLPKDALVYCDIPYKGTGEYKEGDFNHDDFYAWFANINQPAYLSEYKAPFEIVSQNTHRSTLSASNNNKQVKERLYWNGKGKVHNFKLF